jgi:hypothetical protein
MNLRTKLFVLPAAAAALALTGCTGATAEQASAEAPTVKATSPAIKAEPAAAVEAPKEGKSCCPTDGGEKKTDTVSL